VPDGEQSGPAVSERTYRVIVRGFFTDLDEAQRAALLGEVDEHDILSAAFTDAGTLIYDRALRNFTVRCVVRQSSEARPGVDDAAAVQSGCDVAAAILAERGLRHSPLRATAICMEDIKIKRRPAKR
jgi:hypothetical protein